MPTEKGVLVFRSYSDECVSSVFDVHGVSKGWLACRPPKPTTMYIRTGSALYNYKLLVQQLRLTAKQGFANASSGVFLPDYPLLAFSFHSYTMHGSVLRQNGRKHGVHCSGRVRIASRFCNLFGLSNLSTRRNKFRNNAWKYFPYDGQNLG